MNTRQILKGDLIGKSITEMADAHCHLDLINDQNAIRDAIENGVHTIITNGVDTKSNMRNIELLDNRNIFALMGVDPEHANVTNEELEFNLKLIRQHSRKVTGIGEIGLDYGRVEEAVNKAQQMEVFKRLLNLAKELKFPVSIHSRNAMNDILHILEEMDMKRVHIHFFEGNVQQAKEIEKKGYMISVPPVQSSRRDKVIKEIAIDNIMAESDAPIVGLSPKDIERSIGIVAGIKRIDFKRAADLLTQNTKRFFKIQSKETLMRI